MKCMDEMLSFIQATDRMNVGDRPNEVYGRNAIFYSGDRLYECGRQTEGSVWTKCCSLAVISAIKTVIIKCIDSIL